MDLDISILATGTIITMAKVLEEEDGDALYFATGDGVYIMEALCPEGEVVELREIRGGWLSDLEGSKITYAEERWEYYDDGATWTLFDIRNEKVSLLLSWYAPAHNTTHKVSFYKAGVL